MVFFPNAEASVVRLCHGGWTFFIESSVVMGRRRCVWLTYAKWKAGDGRGDGRMTIEEKLLIIRYLPCSEIGRDWGGCYAVTRLERLEVEVLQLIYQTPVTY